MHAIPAAARRRQFPLGGRFLPALFAALLLTLVSVAQASSRSAQLTGEGADALAAGRFEEALAKFEAGVEADRSDAEVVFFQGVALNRLSRFTEALGSLQAAAERGCDHSDLGFETGWCLVHLERWAEAAGALERFERAHPGRGQTSEFLGRAYLGLGRQKDAETSLHEALRRDPGLLPTVSLYLARIEERRRHPDASHEYLHALITDAPDSRTARELRGEMARLALPDSARGAAQRPWHLALAVGGGYNSNVVTLNDDLLLPSDISRRHAAFGQLGASGSYEWRLGDADTLGAGYAFQWIAYDGFSVADLMDHTWQLEFRHRFSERFSASLRASDEFTQIGGDSFRNQATLAATLSCQLASWNLAELSYTFGNSDYMFPVFPAQDRDARSHSVALVERLTLPRTKLELTAAGFALWNGADGRDNDGTAIGYRVALRHPLFWKISAEAAYGMTFDRSENSISITGPDGISHRRKVDTHSVSAQLSRPLTDWLNAYARYNYNRADGNLRFFEYGQHIFAAGLLVQY